MKNYKITNLKSNVVHFMNEKEKNQFIKINHKNNSYYIAEELQENNKKETLKIYLFLVFAVALTFASFRLYLQLNY